MAPAGVATDANPYQEQAVDSTAVDNAADNNMQEPEDHDEDEDEEHDDD